MKKNWILIILSSLFVLGSCNSENKEAITTEVIDFNIELGGLLNFGRVGIEDKKRSKINITKNTSNDSLVTVDLSELNESLYLVSKGDSCLINNNIINLQANCSLWLEFSPKERKEYSSTVKVGGKSFTFSGEGIVGAGLSFSWNYWNIGTIFAGSNQEKNLIITNSGDTPIDKPILTDNDLFEIAESDCPDTLLTSDKCTYKIRYQENLSGSKNNSFVLSSNNGPSYNFDTVSLVRPSIPSGLVVFDSIPSKIQSNGEDQYSITARFFDEFGNIVENGYTVNVSGQNINFPNGQNFTVIDGKVEFEILSTTTSGEVEVVVQSGQASGVFKAPTSTGAPYGPITFKNYNQIIRADGITELVVVSNDLYDVNNNEVDDGFELNVTTSDPLTIVNTTVSTYNHVATVIIRAQNTAGDFSVTISDGTNETTGTFDVKVIPEAADGDYLVSSNLTSIYADHESQIDFDKETEITIGPISDINDNLVGAGQTVNISLINGVLASGNYTEQNFSLTTGEDSMARFNLAGNGLSGWITIDAQVDSYSVIHKVWSSYDQSIRYGTNNDLEVFYAVTDKSLINSLLPSSDKWTSYKGNLYSLSNIDSNFIGSVANEGVTTHSDVNLKNVYSSCLLPVNHFTFIAPCSGYIVDGQTSIGGTPPYTLNTLKSDTVYEYNNYQTGLSGEGSFFQGSPLMLDYIYHKNSDRALILGMHDVSSSGITNDKSNIISYSFPSSLKTTFDPLYYEVLPLDLDGIETSLKAMTPYNGDSLLYGGLSISYSVGSDPDFSVGDGLFRLSKHIPTEEELDNEGDIPVLELNEVEIEDGTLGEPGPRFGASLYIEESRVYLIGGYQQDELIEDNTAFIFKDEIWMVDLNSQTPTWSRICDSCAIPLPQVDMTNYFLSFTGSIDYTSIFAFEQGKRRPQIIKDDSRGELFFFYQNDDEFYSLDLDSKSFTLNSNSEHFLNKLLSQNKPLIYNRQESRYTTIRTDDESKNRSKFMTYDLSKDESKANLFSFQLNEGSRRASGRIGVNFAGWAFQEVNGSRVYGVSLWIYNYTESRWDLLLTNQHQGNYQSYTNPNYYEMDCLIGDYMDADAKIHIRAKHLNEVNPTRLENIGARSSINISHISIEGIW